MLILSALIGDVWKVNELSDVLSSHHLVTSEVKFTATYSDTLFFFSLLHTTGCIERSQVQEHVSFLNAFIVSP